ncbi:MAG: hypothetical protein JWO94_3063 [Verrucomicrobiaceae bacterium]|nr:hypothetical protein [Verrucomicrobiaceae bacterium]
MTYGIGIDLGGTQIKSARFDLSTGRLLATAMAVTNNGQSEGPEPRFAAAVRGLVHQHEAEAGEKAAVVGISAPGLAARDGSRILRLPGKLDGLENLVWEDFLQCPARCLNDAHAALMGEIWQGAAKGRQDVVMLTLGTGVGGAVMCEGRLLKGHGGRAGHLGHLTVDMDGPPDGTGMPGSLEDAIGNASLPLRTGGRFSMTRDLIAAMKSGDAGARQVWDRSLRALAVAVAGLINAFDPEIVLIGGGISNAWPHIQPGLYRWLEEFEWRPSGTGVPVRPASLGEWAGCHGAVDFARPHN